MKKEKVAYEQARIEYPEWIKISDQTKHEIISKLSTTNVIPKAYFKKLIKREKNHNFLNWYISINFLIIIFIILSFWIIGALFALNSPNFQTNIFYINSISIFLLVGFILLSIIFLPLAYLMPYGDQKIYKHMIEALEMGDIQSLAEKVLDFETGVVIQIREVDKSWYWYFKALTLYYGKNYAEAINILNRMIYDSSTSIIGKILYRSFWQNNSFRFEYLFVTGDCYIGLGEIEQAIKSYSEALIGFKICKIKEPIKYLENRINFLNNPPEM